MNYRGVFAEYFNYHKSHLLSIELDGSLWEVESLLNKASQFSDSSSLFSENILGSGGHDDDLGSCWSHTDLNTGVTILGQLLGEEAVQFGLEHTIGHKLQTENAAFVGKF